MDNELRRSKRLLSEPPEVFSTPLLRVTKQAENRTGQVEEKSTSSVNLMDIVSVKTASRRSQVSKASTSKSEAARLRMQAEFESMQRMGKAEQEFLEEKLSLAKARLEREKILEKKRLEIQMAGLEEESEDDESQILEDIPVPHPSSRENVNNWLRNGNVQLPSHNVHENSNNAMMNVSSRLDKFLSRQAVPKELSIFGGEPEEWPLFIQQYRRTSELCGLSNDENMIRLTKCLKGKAREAVLPILGFPENVALVIETLELMFGRCDQIIYSMTGKIKSLPPPTRSKPQSIILFSNMVANLVATIKNMKQMGHLYNPQLLHELLSKLSVEQQYDWGTLVADRKDLPNLEDFGNWLKRNAIAVSFMPLSLSFTKEEKFAEKKKEKRNEVVAVGKENKKCFHCSGESHALQDCKGFTDADVSDRWKTVKKGNICFCCLNFGHKSQDCRKKSVCGTDGCDRFHHKLLHKTINSTSAKLEARVGNWAGHVKAGGKTDVLLRILPVRISGPNGDFNTYTMLDEGSTVTMIDADFAGTLGFRGPVEPLCIQWTNELTREEMESRRVMFEVSGMKTTKTYRIYNARTVENMSLPIQNVDMDMMRKKWPYLEDIPFETMENARPLLLIGSDNILLSTARKLRQGHWNDPVATKTWLGWVVHGNLPKQGKAVSTYNFHVCETLNNDELGSLFRQTFTTESFGVRVVEGSARSNEDQKAMEIMRATTKRVGSRFQTGLLWKNDDVTLPESRTNALRRLSCMERKMERDAGFAEAYHKKIEDYIEKGYCRKLSPAESSQRGRRTFYLPHFGVFNPNKPGKLRLVMDAAARSHGVGLNDCLLKGPDFLTSLPAVLMRFRLHPVGVVGDIREMFHQVEIIPADVDSQRFLWRGRDRTQPVEEYVMRVMIFGASCSPSSALYVKDLNAEEFKMEFPEAAEGILKNTYMDDFIHGASTEKKAVKLIEDAIELFSRAGFYICNWASSSKTVMKSLPPDLRAKNLVELSEEAELSTERVLGLLWDAENDCFVFKTNYPKVKEEILKAEKVPTKREMASLVMSVYDPLGLVVHFTIKGRIIFQEAWATKSDWDEEIPAELFKQWKWWVLELPQISLVRVPRCYSLNLGEASSIQLHVFVDASSKAFSAVAYFRVDFGDEIQVTLVLGRARVAPLKPLTIPKLELQAALMGCRLAKTVKEQISICINSTVYWSDSQTVLSWLRSPTTNPRQFVAVRIGEILESSNAEEWRWVPTDDNVADEATRPLRGTKFEPGSRWYTGPEFIKFPENEWPKEKSTNLDTTNEVESNFVMIALKPQFKPVIPDVFRFSSWEKFVRSTVWFQRALLAFKGERITGEITGKEFLQAETLCWGKVQADSFGDDLKILREGGKLPASSRLRNLSPAIDGNGIIRLCESLREAEELSEETKYPVILDPKHRYTQLLLGHLHRKFAHQGIETVINELRLTYWILDVRAAVKKAFANCRICRIRKAIPRPPEMASLPFQRVNKPGYPFQFTGIDFFGPMSVSFLRRSLKRYGVIFTCFSTRAVHLEIAPDLTTHSAVNAIRRFIARRAVPEIIWSDNGTNFHGSDKELRMAVEDINKDEVTRKFANTGMTWRYNPPAAPHMGGVWERLVKSVKVALSATLKDSSPREDVLQTLLTEAEFIINNRPLTHISVDPADPRSLTPNDFLRCGRIRSFIPGDFADGKYNLRKQWQLVQVLTEKLWSRWVKEYLPTLTRRAKWLQPVRPICVGDIVVIGDPNGPRNSWPLGRITEVHPGKDGQVRSVDVQTKDGVFTRPATKICVLDVTENEEDGLLQGEEL